MVNDCNKFSLRRAMLPTAHRLSDVAFGIKLVFTFKCYINLGNYYLVVLLKNV